MDSVITSDRVFIIMELVEGFTLEQYLSRKGMCDEIEGRILLRQLLLGVEYLHSIGILHLDLSPSNLMISADSLTLKIADFGSA